MKSPTPPASNNGLAFITFTCKVLLTPSDHLKVCLVMQQQLHTHCMHFRQRWFDGTSWYLMRILNMPQTYGRPFRCSASFWRAPDSFPFLWILQDISKRWLFCFSIISSRSIISRHSTKHQQFTFGSSLWSHGFTCHKKAESTTITDEDNKAMTASS